MIRVELDHILTEEDALAKIQDIFRAVEENGEPYVITKAGRPAVTIAPVAAAEKPDQTPQPKKDGQPELPPLPILENTNES